MAPKQKPSGVGTGIRRWLIVSFVAMCAGFLASAMMGVLYEETFLENPLYWAFQLTLWFGTFAAFVLSILHLVRYSEKGMAVTFLVISGLVLLLLVMAFLVGLLVGIANSMPAQ